jgi:sugar phosphate permease
MMGTAEVQLSYASRRGRWVLLATVLGSAIAFIDATVVGIALPAIGRDFGANLTTLPWVVTAYTLTLAGLLLFAGTLGDRYGRRRIFLAGVIWFAVASLICGLALPRRSALPRRMARPGGVLAPDLRYQPATGGGNRGGRSTARAQVQ